MRGNLLILMAFFALPACDDGEDPADLADMGVSEGFPLAGSWIDAFGTTHLISEAEWVQTFDGQASTFHVIAIDTEARQVVAHNDAANMFNPSLYSRFDWTVEGESVYVCQSAFDAATQEAAEATPPADPTNLEAGCGASGFAWSELLPN